MHNRFVLDQNYNVRLLCNIQEPYDDVEHWRNSILVEIEADSTPDQYIIVTGADGYTETFDINPGRMNTFTFSTFLWNYGGLTVVDFYKNDQKLSDKTLYITFPDIVEGSGAISSDFQIDGIIYLGQNYTMAGSYYSDPETIKEIEQKVEQVEEDVGTIQQDVSGLSTDVENNTQAITNLQNLITISNVDIVAGTTPLETGHLYLVYEVAQ